MNKCKWLIDGKIFDTKDQADRYIQINKLSGFAQEIQTTNYQEVYQKKLDAHNDFAKQNLKEDKARKKALEQQYSNTTALLEDMEVYTDDRLSVLEHIYDRYVKPLSIPNYTQKYGEILKANDPSISISEINRLTLMNIRSWDYIKKSGIALDAIATIVFNPNGQFAHFIKDGKFDYDKFIKDYTTNPLTGEVTSTMMDLEGMSPGIINKFFGDMQHLRNKIVKKGDKVYTQFVAQTDNAAPKRNLRGKLDLVVLKPDGSIEIYDYKVSTRDAGDLNTDNSSQWDRDKREAVIHLMAYYKKMVEAIGIPTEKISTYLIPITLEGINEKSDGLFEITRIKVATNPISVPVYSAAQLRAREDIDVNFADTIESENFFLNIEGKASKLFNVTKVGKLFTEVSSDMFHDGSIKGNEVSGYRFTYKNSDGIYVQVKAPTIEEITEKYKERRAVVNADFRETSGGIIARLAKRLILFNQGKYSYHGNNSRIFEDSDKIPLNIEQNLVTYFSEPGWKVLDPDAKINNALMDLNAVVLINDNNPDKVLIDIIMLSDKNLDKVYKLGKGTNILGRFLPDNEVDNHKVMKGTMGNMLIMRGALIGNELLASRSNAKIGNIKAMTIRSDYGAKTSKGLMTSVSSVKLWENYKLLMHHAGISALNNLKEDSFIPITDLLLNMYSAAFSDIPGMRLSPISKEKLTQSFKDLFGNPNINEKAVRLRALIDMWNTLIEMPKFKHYNADTIESIGSDRSIEAHLFRMTALALAEESELIMDLFNVNLLKEWGYEGDIRLAWEQRRVLNGTMINTIDTIPIMKGIHDKIQAANMNVRVTYEKYKNPTIAKFDAVRKGGWMRFFDHSEDGLRDFRLLNPEDSSNGLSQSDREFLTWWLEEVNNRLAPEGKLTESLRRDLKATGDYYNVPLFRSNAASRLLSIGPVLNLKEGYKAGRDAVHNLLNIPHQDRPDNMRTKDFRDMLKLYDTFGADVRVRNDLLINAEGNPFAKFDSNLETILDELTRVKFMLKEYNKILPGISAAVATLSFTSYLSGKDAKALYDFVNNYIKSAVFNESLTEGDIWGHKFMNQAKGFVSKAILGWNVLSGAKEVISGMWIHYSRGLATSVTNMFFGEQGNLNFTNMTKGYMNVWVDAVQQPFMITLLERMNRHFGIGNMDTSQLADNWNRHAKDFARFNYFLFWSNRAPDFLNKMTFLVGYMHQHGIFDAYSADAQDGLKYDWKKDKRFNLLATNNQSNMTEYLKQKALYSSLMRDFVKDGRQVYDETTKEMRDIRWDETNFNNPKNDQLPDGYGRKEIQAIKLEADMTFGYMDHETKSMMFKKGIFTLVGQFKTFATAKKNQWFLTRGDYDQGRRVHMVNESGLKLYFLPEIDSTGNVTRMTQTTELFVTIEGKRIELEPVYDWMGSPMEGIFWSLIDLVNVLRFDNFKKAWNDPVKIRNLVIAMNDAFFIMFIAWLLGGLFGTPTKGKHDFRTEDTSWIDRNMSLVFMRAAGDVNALLAMYEVVLLDFTVLEWSKRIGLNLVAFLPWTEDKMTGYKFISNGFGITSMWRKELQDKHKEAIAE